MARKETTSKSRSGFERPVGRPHPIAAIACGLVALLLVVAMGFFSPDQTEMLTTHPTETNPVGKLGANLALAVFRLLGHAGWLLPAALLVIAVFLVRRSTWLTWVRILVLFVVLASGAGLLDMQDLLRLDVRIGAPGHGGMIGHAIYSDFLRHALGPFGSAVLLGTFYAGGLLFAFVPNLREEARKLAEEINAWHERRAEERRLLSEAREAERKAREVEAAERKLAEVESSPPPRPAERARNTASATPVPAPQPVEQDPAAGGSGPEVRPRAPVPAPAASSPQAAGSKPADAAAQPQASALATSSPAPAAEVDDAPAEPASSRACPAGDLRIVTPEAPTKAAQPIPEKKGDYVFPPLSLLSEPVRATPEANAEEHRRNAETLVRTLEEFGIKVALGEIHTGPVITRYELMPAPGIRVERISSLDKNLALSLRAQSVRILAPVPGKGCVGVEVPNAKPTPVGIRELLESQEWAGANAEIPLALGREVTGRPVVADLARMPHLLIAGATGSGKSVCINSIITSLLYRYPPDDLRLIMVDPKIVELSVYNDLPHMLIPVVTQPKKVPGALRWLISEMEQRYQFFARAHVRNISGFNNRRKRPARKENEAEGNLELDLPLPAGTEEPLPDRLPYIVCIMDEIADLMMVAPAEIETGIARLAQLARAAGIHLILATQRPSVNVITGVIKANLPCRIAFQVASAVDSRTILDSKGAEQLIGRGDMLFAPPGSGRLLRCQGAFVSDEEVRDIVDFLKRNGPPRYADAVQAAIERAAREQGDEAEGDDAEGLNEGADEELVKASIQVLKATGRASTSMLQRRLRIGYNRAARVMDLLEERGIVGPENGAQPRQILVDLDSL